MIPRMPSVSPGGPMWLHPGTHCFWTYTRSSPLDVSISVLTTLCPGLSLSLCRLASSPQGTGGGEDGGEQS
jgi:hypothetical protein